MSLTAKRPSKRDEMTSRLMDTITDGDEQTRVNFDLEKSLYKKFKIRCVEDGRPMSDVLRVLITDYLKK
jgi:hypothetical protein